MERNCGTCGHGDKTDLVTKRTHCNHKNYWAFSHESCGYWKERRYAFIGTDDALKYESHYCNRCTNQKPDDDGGCPVYVLLVMVGMDKVDKAVRDILRLFFPPHPTVEGKLDQCRMFVEKKVCRDCQHWIEWDQDGDPHYCDKVEEDVKGADDPSLPVLYTNGDMADCWMYTPEGFGCPNWEERSGQLPTTKVVSFRRSSS